MKHYSAIKRNELSSHENTRNIKCMLLSEVKGASVRRLRLVGVQPYDFLEKAKL